MKKHRSWHSRGYIPHLDEPGKIQSITIRLFDSMPSRLLSQWDAELKMMAQGGSTLLGKGNIRAEAERRRKIEAFLDAGHGSCQLRDPAIAAMVEEAVLHWDGTRYRLLAWAVMPNHLHCVFEMEEGWPLGEIMKRFKGYTSHEAKRILRAANGRFWYPDYWDRYVRDTAHLRNVTRYIHENPVKAGLVAHTSDWPWSSARFRERNPTRQADCHGKF